MLRLNADVSLVMFECFQYSADEPELMKGDLNARLQGRKAQRPDTPLAKSVSNYITKQLNVNYQMSVSL